MAISAETKGQNLAFSYRPVKKFDCTVQCTECTECQKLKKIENCSKFFANSISKTRNEREINARLKMRFKRKTIRVLRENKSRGCTAVIREVNYLKNRSWVLKNPPKNVEIRLKSAAEGRKTLIPIVHAILGRCIYDLLLENRLILGSWVSILWLSDFFRQSFGFK